MNTVKERPILFNAEMVQAILDGRKTQTRREIKPQLVQPENGAYFDVYYKGPQWNWWAKDGRQYLDQIIKCPFGKIGDRLYVREAVKVVGYDSARHSNPDNPNHYHGSFCLQYSDGKRKTLRFDDCKNISREMLERIVYKKGWTPSIHMPRWASRILLEITDIRVERLNDISDNDVDAEVFGGDYPHNIMPELYGPEEGRLLKECFKILWESVYGAGSFDDKWVWVVDFKVIELKG